MLCSLLQFYIAYCVYGYVYNPCYAYFFGLDDDGIQVVTLGLKSNAIQTVKNQQASYLSQTDWVIIRKADNGTEVPENIQTYRDAIRVKATEMETAITNCSDLDSFIALYTSTHNADGTIDTIAILHDWPQLGE